MANVLPMSEMCMQLPRQCFTLEPLISPRSAFAGSPKRAAISPGASSLPKRMAWMTWHRQCWSWWTAQCIDMNVKKRRRSKRHFWCPKLARVHQCAIGIDWWSGSDQTPCRCCPRVTPNTPAWIECCCDLKPKNPILKLHRYAQTSKNPKCQIKLQAQHVAFTRACRLLHPIGFKELTIIDFPQLLCNKFVAPFLQDELGMGMAPRTRLWRPDTVKWDW